MSNSLVSDRAKAVEDYRTPNASAAADARTTARAWRVRYRRVRLGHSGALTDARWLKRGGGRLGCTVGSSASARGWGGLSHLRLKQAFGQLTRRSGGSAEHAGE